MTTRAEIILSADVEADGPIPGIHSMLSLGLSAIDDPTTTFYVELKPISETFIPEALAVSGLDRQRLMEEGVEPVTAMLQLIGWLDMMDGRPVFASFSTWDWAFVYYYLMRFGGSSPFGHSSLDIKSYLMGRLNLDWRGTTKSALAHAFPDLMANLGPHTHHALDDAREQGELLRRARLINSPRVSPPRWSHETLFPT